ncbi:MAG: NADH-quinone oxidoreductase subunit NuoH [Bryobacterales bacterium]|nr:NADH-quinone oxidoreductase subunit NuoH [Bryobacteraceae bacterium]MDW8131095.1 NADH-quinone oxidoreductase subunit NuoH [Bryobacterales bacterium]
MDYYLITAIKAAALMGFLLLTLLYLQWIERKVIAHVQVRIGPSRVGPHGLLQPVADSLKLLLKEDLVPPHVNKFLYLLAPFLAVTLALLSYAVIPFGPEIEILGVRTRLQLADLDIAVLFVLAVSSMTVYAVVLAGWASNSKYPLLGALRSAAQMISYELPLALAVAAPLLLANTLNLREIVERQHGYYFGLLPRWNVFQLPAPQIVSLVVFVIAMFAETNRVPFDLPEAENELVAGFHTEYSSMKFAAFFMAEYANMITISAMATLLFLGGWLPPWPASLGSNWAPTVLFGGAGALALYHGLNAARARDRRTLPVVAAGFFALALLFAVPRFHPLLVPPFWFLAKVGLLLWIFMWVRGTLPRFRYDQLMRFAWGTLFPIAVVNLVVTALLVAVFGGA